MQRNFPERSGKPDGQARSLTAELEPAPPTTNSPPQSNPPTPAATPRPQPSPSTQAAIAPPTPRAKASQPVSLPTNPLPAQVQQTNPAVSQPDSQGAQTNKPAQLLLREGDVLRISFPGAPTLNTVQQIRRDGNITLPMVGEFKAAGLAPSEAEKELVKLYDPHLLVKEVTVAVESAVFAVYVTGAVLRPGKIMSDRPISAMEAVVEAGLDHAKANLKKVRIIRQENGRTVYYMLDLKQPFVGKPAGTFDLKPSDIIYVPERFSWF